MTPTTPRPDDDGLDPWLEGEIREVLRRHDPGPAPLALRGRALDVPERTPRPRAADTRRNLSVVLGLAATILVAMVGMAVIGSLGGAGLAGATPLASVATGSPAPSPLSSFDPNLEGPGILVYSGDSGLAAVVVVAVIVLGCLALALRGRRRLVPVGIATAIAAWALVASQVPIDVRVGGGYSPGLNVVAASMPPGSGEELLYELAPAGGRFSVGTGLSADAPFPVRVEGIVEPAFRWDPYYGMLWTAIWLDGEPNGGRTGPARPFTPIELQHSTHGIWLVGKAGACAIGPSFDPAAPAGQPGAFGSLDILDIQVSVLGWPRTVRVTIPFHLVEPEPDTCPAPVGPSPSPSVP